MGRGDETGGYSATLVSFGRALRDHDVDVSLAEINEAARAITLIDPLDRGEFYNALKATLLTDVNQEPTFDRLFEAFWGDARAEADGSDERPDRGALEIDQQAPESMADDLERVDRPEADAMASPERLLSRPQDRQAAVESTLDRPGPASAHREDRAAGDQRVALELGRNRRSERLRPPSATPMEAERLSMLVRELGRQLGTVRGYESEPRATGDIDLRRSLGLRERAPPEFPQLDKRETLARAVLFVDVSRSMLRNMDQSFLFRLLFECVQQFAAVRVFFFDTSAREVTAHFERANVQRMREALTEAEAEWGAGTTIGACLAAILSEDPFVVDYNTHSLVISDGWDAGDLDVLERQMTGLSRRSRSVIWLNPPASSPAYAPDVSGMRTALPYVDLFAGFATIDDLEDLVDDLRTSV